MRKFPTTLYLLCAVCTNSYLETVKNFRSSSQIKSISILTLNIYYSNKNQNKKVQTLKKRKKRKRVLTNILCIFFSILGTKGFMGEPAVSPTYCPINGAYTFTYSVNDGTESSLECSTHSSELSDCPYGYGFNLKFQGCSFGNMDMSFHCLGNWQGHDGHQYVALMDTQALGDESRPRYRCAQYHQDEYSGEIKFALSSDSTCTNHLRSPTEGYETLALRPQLQKPWPTHFVGDVCDLPDWVQGQWEYLHVQGGSVLLKDNRNFKTFSARCVKKQNEEKFLLYARSHCGEEHYKCVWFKNRGINALEFQVGKYLHPFLIFQESTNIQVRKIYNFPQSERVPFSPIVKKSILSSL